MPQTTETFRYYENMIEQTAKRAEQLQEASERLWHEQRESERRADEVWKALDRAMQEYEEDFGHKWEDR